MKRFYSLLISVFLINGVYAQNCSIPLVRANSNGSSIIFQSGKTPIHPVKIVPPETSVQEDMRMLAPANDNCTGGLSAAYTLIPDAACVQGNMNNATLEATETYGCISPTPYWSVWYSFVADATSMYASVSQLGGTICSLDFGLRVYWYDGTNCPPLSSSAVGCADDRLVIGPNNFNDSAHTTVYLSGLTIGATFLIQITQENCTTGPSNVRQYCIEVGHPTTCTTCSNPCGSLCYYPSSSPPTVAWLSANCPLYSLRPPKNESDNRTMSFSFTTPNTIVNLQLGNTSRCNGYTYSFNRTCYSSSCGAPIASGSYTPTTISGLTTGQNYILCYNWTTTCSFEQVVPYIYAANTLPIELRAFEAKTNKNDIDIYWTTASEINAAEKKNKKTTNKQNNKKEERTKTTKKTTTIRN